MDTQDNVKESIGQQDVLIAVFACVLCFIIALVKIYGKRDAPSEREAKQRAGNSAANSTKKHAQVEKTKEKPKSNQSKAKKHQEKDKDKDKDKEAKDPWLFTTLKGHTSMITSMDYSTNGKYLATCADDRTVLLWDVREIAEKEHTTCKSFRVNLDGDSADLVRWSPDSRAFVVHRVMDNSCQVHRVEKKDGGGFVTTPTKIFAKTGENDVIAMSIAPDGKFILTASSNNVITFWDLKGPSEITRVNTGLKSTTNVIISSCGQFIAACGTDATVWTINRKEIGNLKKAFDLKNVCHLSFDRNGTKLATISTGGDWKVYDVPPVAHARTPIIQASGESSVGSSPPMIAISPLGDTLVTASKDLISFYKIYRPNEPAELHRAINVGGAVSQLLFDPEGKYLFVVCKDRHIKVFTNATKYACELDLANAKLKEPQTSATRERLTQLVQECQTRLNNLCPQ